MFTARRLAVIAVVLAVVACDDAAHSLTSTPSTKAEPESSSPCQPSESSNAILSFSTQRDDGFAQFLTASPDGEILLTAAGGGGTTVFSPDGTLFAFDTARGTFRVQHASPCSVAPIEVEGSFPKWSPDGSRLAFFFGGDVYLINADGTGRKNLTDLPFYLDGQSTIEWSPDGDEILFDSNRNDNGNLWVMEADGHNQRQVSQSSFPDSNPDWSPDGRQILTWSTRDGGGLTLMNADGSGQRMVVADLRVLGFSWSPDGRRILFATTRDGNVEIYTSDADGRNQTNLTNTDADEGFHPVWSPDGSQIAFDSSRQGTDDIFVMDADGANVVRWTSTDAREFAPLWIP